MRALRYLLIAGLVVGVASSAQAAEIPVTTNLDTIADDGLCSLREAVLRSARLPRGRMPRRVSRRVPTSIRLGAGTFRLSIAGADDLNQTGDLDTGPTNAVRVVGAGSAATIIDANEVDRVFDVFATATLSLEDLAIIQGVAPQGVGGRRGQEPRNAQRARGSRSTPTWPARPTLEPGRVPGGGDLQRRSRGRRDRRSTRPSTANRGGRGYSGGNYDGGVRRRDRHRRTAPLSVSGSTFWDERRRGVRPPEAGTAADGGAIAIGRRLGDDRQQHVRRERRRGRGHERRHHGPAGPRLALRGPST